MVIYVKTTSKVVVEQSNMMFTVSRDQEIERIHCWTQIIKTMLSLVGRLKGTTNTEVTQT